MSNARNNKPPAWERVIELAEAGKMPRHLCEFWEREHGIHPVDAAELTQTARRQERASARYFHVLGIGAVAIIIASSVIATQSTQVATLFGVSAFVLLCGPVFWRCRVLDGRAMANRKLGKSMWEFAEALDAFADLIRPAEVGSVACYSHQGLKDLAERELRAVARLVLETEAWESPADAELPHVARVTDRAKSLHWGLRQTTEQMKVLGLSDGDYGRYYKLARRDLK